MLIFTLKSVAIPTRLYRICFGVRISNFELALGSGVFWSGVLVLGWGREVEMGREGAILLLLRYLGGKSNEDLPNQLTCRNVFSSVLLDEAEGWELSEAWKTIEVSLVEITTLEPGAIQVF